MRKLLIKIKKIDGVIHFAGLKSVKESFYNPILYWDSNVYSSINLLKVMVKFECKTIVFSSSSTIYGQSQKLKIDESCITNPIDPYGTTKMVIEKLLINLNIQPESDWRIANLRYFNPIGAHTSGFIGDNPRGVPNNIFPCITKVAIGDSNELEIFGNDWNTKDGTAVRDYIHVMDLAEGHVRTLEYLKNTKSQY